MHKHTILLYAEHIDGDGHVHYGVDEYDSCTGIVTRFSDYFDLKKKEI